MAQIAFFFLSLIWDKKKIVVEGENGGLQHFLLLPQCVQKASSTVCLKQAILLEIKSLPNKAFLMETYWYIALQVLCLVYVQSRKS